MKRSRTALALCAFLSAAAAGSAFAESQAGTPDTLSDDPSIGTSTWTTAGLPSSSSVFDASASATSHYLVLKDFDFNIPTDAAILGIEVSITRSASLIFADEVHDQSIRLVNNNVIGGTNKASASAWPGSAGAAAYGSPSDVWGISWEPSDINALGFGVAISATAIGSFTTSAVANVQAVLVTVTYTRPCPVTLDTSGCDTSFEIAQIKIDEHKIGNEKFQATLGKGGALTQGQLGNFVDPNGPELHVCVYDGAGQLAGHLAVAESGQNCGSAPCWKAVGDPFPDGKGFLYKDLSASAHGVTSIKLSAGEVGRTKAQLKASGMTGLLPLGIAAALDGNAAATLQIREQNGSLCLSGTMMTVSKNADGFFYAKK
jgi:hypothetical protein